MLRKNSNVAQRAWNRLRLAVIWARKGRVFRRRFLMDLRFLPNFIKSLTQSNPHSKLHYGEHELSFDETPVFHLRMNRPASSVRFYFPCITPKVDFDYESDGGADEEEEEQESGNDEEEDGIDLRAEKFIAKFYEQMKLQRQISYLQYQ